MGADCPRLLGFAMAIVAVGLASAARAGISTDGTVGPRVELSGPAFAIGAGLGRQAGHNLFHSFERFSLATGERATFSGPADVRNIISRVTGGERSDIDGTIASSIPGADFYFINPAGVVFGPNATLDVQGSFHVSTADELRFADGAVFSATDPAASSLTVAAPEAFGFLGRGGAPIRVLESGLLVPEGEALSLVGGEVEVSGGLTGIVLAPAGRVTLAALAGPGELRIADGASTAAPGGRVTLDDFAIVQVSGDGGGSVLIRAGEFVLTDNSFILADNLGPADATAGVDIAVGDARIDDGSAIVAEVLGSGAGPDLTLRATGTILVSEGGFLSSRSLGTGAPGAVSLDADVVHLAGSARRAPTGIATDPLDPTSPANAGPVTIRAGRELRIENGSQVSTQTAVNRGGPITLTAPRIVIADATVTSSVTDRAEAAGTIRISGDAVSIRDGGIVASDSSGLGRGGRIDLDVGAGGLTIEDGFITASTAGAGGGGRVDVRTTGAIRLQGGAILSVASGTGDAGDLRFQADRLVVSDGGVIASQSAISGGGRITILAADLVDLDHGELSTSVLGGADTTAGDITINPDFLVMSNSEILARATAGTGGSIRIAAGQLVLSPDSRINASADTGIDGSVFVSTPESDLSAGLVVLDAGVLDVSSLPARCGTRRDIGASSFTGVGRAGLPPSPDAPLAGGHLGPGVALAAARSALSAAAPPSALVLPCAPRS